MPDWKKKKILLMGSRVTITNMPIKEVNLIAQGSLPAYGYDPGDFIELMAGKVTIEEGRLEQCLTWLSSYLTASGLNPRISTLNYGVRRDVFQIFKKRSSQGPVENDHGWFMVQQILPPGGRSTEPDHIEITNDNKSALEANNGIVIIDDGGNPPRLAGEIKELNPGAWAIALGISAAHWQGWVESFKENFILICRLSDLETTRMEMDSSILWESTVAMAVRALKSPEVGLWDERSNRFKCHIMVEMFPDGILYIGPETAMFRHWEGALPGVGSRNTYGSVPCYDTLLPAMLSIDCLRIGGIPLDSNYFFDLSKRVLLNWHQLHQHGYYFTDGLEFPNLDFSSTYPTGVPCSFLNTYDDPCFFVLPPFTPHLEHMLEIVSSQSWCKDRKQAIRSFFRANTPANQCETTGPAATARDLGYIGVILSVLKHLKEEVNRKAGFKYLRLFQVGALRTTDPVEIEPVMALQRVMDSYVTKEHVKRPLCVGVFGPPGSGKSFAVEEVARVISKRFDRNPFEFFQFNLTQFSGPEEINSAIDLVRASVAKGRIPITFWDEFDCRYDGFEFGYLRYFLPSMQDGVTYVNGIPRHIGRSIFVFAGGVKESWDDMTALLQQPSDQIDRMVKALKIPDFMSRLRVVLDIEGIKIPEELLRDSTSGEDLETLRMILLKRAFIIAHQMDNHWPKAARKTSGLLLRLLIARYKFGARSIEAVIESSHAADRLVYGLPELIAPPAARIHAEWRIDLERRVDQIRKEFGLRGVW
ncbi:MAG: ATPase [Dissulfurimicrobium sp.]|uniref:ATPase n=1 Tax=Dissulfurimicrobium sp. TaxID=2022436 RepID=UPI003D0AEAF0